MTLTSILLRWVARNSDALVKFVTDLDAKLDQFLLKADGDVAAFEQDIRDIKDEAEAKAREVFAAAENEARQIEDAIAEKRRALRILAGVKQALPTGE